MDFARSLICWAVHSQRAKDVALTDNVWSELCRRQSRKPSSTTRRQSGVVDACEYFGVSSADDANTLLATLQCRASPTIPSEVYAPVTWPCMLVCLCETRQALTAASVGLDGIRRVLAAPPASYASAIADHLQKLLHDGAASNRCFMVSIVERALSVLDANAVHSPGAADVGLTPDHYLAVLASASRCVCASAGATVCCFDRPSGDRFEMPYRR